MSRDLDDLNPAFLAVVEPWLADCHAAGMDILVTCTLRTNEEQAALYAQGRTAPGRIVTNAQPGQSAHNYGLGVDIVPIVNGKPEWTGEDPIWRQIANFAEARGLEWLGEPSSPFKEECHFQQPNWRTIAGV